MLQYRSAVVSTKHLGKRECDIRPAFLETPMNIQESRGAMNVQHQREGETGRKLTSCLRNATLGKQEQLGRPPAEYSN